MKIAPCQMVSAGFLFTVSRWGEWFPVDLRMRRCIQQRHGSSHDVVKSPGASTEATPPWSPREGQMKKSLRLGDCYHVSTVTHWIIHLIHLFFTTTGSVKTYLVCLHNKYMQYFSDWLQDSFTSSWLQNPGVHQRTAQWLVQSNQLHLRVWVYSILGCGLDGH